MNEPSVLTRMRLSCCWGDNLNEKELNEVVDYINHLKRENKQLKSMICPIYEKCQKGECDCTHEEYSSMCETNIKMSVELNKYKSNAEKLKKIILELDEENKKLFNHLTIDKIKEGENNE